MLKLKRSLEGRRTVEFHDQKNWRCPWTPSLCRWALGSTVQVLRCPLDQTAMSVVIPGTRE